MCDYSLESIASRPAKKGEKLILIRFKFSSKGFASPEDIHCAVCCEPGMTMTLHLPDGDADVTFAQKDKAIGWMGNATTYRDGVRMPDGEFRLLQTFEAGLQATVIKPLPEAIATAVDAGTAFEPEVAVEPVE